MKLKIFEQKKTIRQGTQKSLLRSNLVGQGGVASVAADQIYTQFILTPT